VLLIPAPVIAGLFPGAWAYSVARISARRGVGWALVVAPFAWVALEWARLGAIGQLWNALAYSQAFTPALIQSARWGGVYLVGFLIVSVNSAVAYLILRRNGRALSIAVGVALLVAAVVFLASYTNRVQQATTPSVAVVAVQPNVAADFPRSAGETALLLNRHLTLATDALRELDGAQVATAGAGDDVRRGLPRVVVWPESPMNFRYARDENFRDFVAEFARANRASVIFNAVEPAPMGGVYNSAVMVNEEGRLVAQYDKIRLLPFGEYVPLPRWLPPAWLLDGLVGDFAMGNDYPLMPVGDARAGVFICFESAFPSVAGRFARDGADVLVNITNDGYLGQTPVVRQHLANVVFRAVETGRPVLRVTNTGVSAHVTPRGEVLDATGTYRPDVRTWTVGRAVSGKTFYARQGDLFVALCAAAAAAGLLSTFNFRRSRAT
ncbi:MAG TPA: apolipoprotein N-acyltransferase, partial [Pyrinomonadaceae bacterium]